MAEQVQSPPQKVSRYRSQRKAQLQAHTEEVSNVPETPQNAPVEDTIARNRSRYHRKNAASGQTTRPATARNPGATETDGRFQAPSPPRPVTSALTSTPSRYHRSGTITDQPNIRQPSPPVQAGAPEPGSQYVDRDGYGAENDRKQHYSAYDASRNVDPTPAVPPPTGELFPPPRPEPVRPVTRPVLLDGPPSSDRIRATKSMSQLPSFKAEDSDSDVGGGCFGLFKRKRSDGMPAKFEKAQNIQPGQLRDAPVSAVNSGDRRVLIECGKSKSIFPVTTTTTPVELIRSAANCMSERINVRSAVLLESFNSVGVQRPLRRYERVRDVLNSWDTDRQNSLILIEPGTGRSEIELSIAGAPQEPPEASWWLSYSQKVGKWETRFITLRQNGQIISQKDPDKPQQWDNVCHVNDFDIYTPTPEKLKKKVKPPKKFCYAIKSQQKTIMFESTQNFVHFFSTGDKATADDFYAAVQGWRSWYLVNVMGEGKKTKSPDAAPAASGAADKEVGGAVKSHRYGESMDSHYQLGSFKPLIDLDQFEKRPTTSRSANAPPPSAGGFTKSANQFDPMVSPERRTSTRKKPHHPPVSLANKAQLADDEPLANLTGRASLDNGRPTAGDFEDSGLLGRSYSRRQREAAQRENGKAQPFTNGPNLLSNGYNGDLEDQNTRRQSLDGPKRQTSTRHRSGGGGDVHRSKSSRTHASGDIGRSGSVRAKEPSAPLIDLTPQYREPPQHVKKGKGHRPELIGPGGLIDSATSPDDPIAAPPSTDWRGRNAQTTASGSGIKHSPSQHGRARSMSRRDRPPKSRSPDDGVFTGEGLLADGHAQRGWGGGNKGRGVADMSQASQDKPLLDLRIGNQFAPGTLLNKVERVQPQGPIIDRSA